jgi:transposase-like protein/IS1 family transposase
MSDTAPVNLMSLIERFRDEDSCREYLVRLRWPNGPVCPRCESTSISKIDTRDQLDCNSCRYRFSVRVGTIFHDSKLPLWKWFIAIYLMCESKKGISANQLKRTLGVSYKTAWYLCHRIREAMGDDDSQPLLKGVIQIDETWVGGKKKAGKRHGRRHMATVVGAVADDGRIELRVVKGRDRESLHAFIEKYTDPTDRIIVTDGWPHYAGFSDDPSQHVAIPKESRGRRRERVVDGLHTQNIENAWSLLKRSIIGSYHKVSVKHLDRYLDELEWRFSNRKNPFLFRDTVKCMIEADSLQYKTLTA